MSGSGVIPADADGAFLLWIEVSETNRLLWLLRQRATRETFTATQLLYRFPPYSKWVTGHAADSLEAMKNMMMAQYGFH